MKAEDRHEEHMKRARVDAIDKEHKQAIALLRRVDEPGGRPDPSQLIYYSLGGNP